MFKARSASQYPLLCVNALTAKLHTQNCWVLGFLMNSCFTLHLYSEGDWAYAGHSNPNPNAEDTKHKCVRPLTRRKQLRPLNPQSSQSEPQSAPFREPSSLLPWNWKLAFSSNPRRGRGGGRLSKTELLTFFNWTKKVWLFAPVFSCSDGQWNEKDSFK